jgi:hypothetical protein
LALHYNFDPLDLYNSLGDDAWGRKSMREVEVVQVRFAMLGITAFAMLELLTDKPIIENKLFFEPNAI